MIQFGVKSYCRRFSVIVVVKYLRSSSSNSGGGGGGCSFFSLRYKIKIKIKIKNCIAVFEMNEINIQTHKMQLITEKNEERFTQN